MALAQRNDCQLVDLRAQGWLGANPDMEYKWLAANLGIKVYDYARNDCWMKYWDSIGIAKGAFNDRAYAWLRTLYPAEAKSIVGNGDFSKTSLGTGLLSGDDVTFDTIGNWVPGNANTALSSIAGGNPGNCMQILNSSGSGASIRADLTAAFSNLTVGGCYKCVVDLKAGDYADSANIYTKGIANELLKTMPLTNEWVTHEIYFNAVNANTGLLINSNTLADAGKGFLVDNVQLSPVTPAFWTLQTGWNLEAVNGELTGNLLKTAGTGSNVEQNVDVTVGQPYTFTFTVSGRTAGKVFLNHTEGIFRHPTSPEWDTNGTHTVTLDATHTGALSIRGDSLFNGKITDVILQDTADPYQEFHINELWTKFWCDAAAGLPTAPGGVPAYGGLGGRWPLIPDAVKALEAGNPFANSLVKNGDFNRTDVSAEIVNDNDFTGDGSAWTMASGWTYNTAQNRLDAVNASSFSYDNAGQVFRAGGLYRIEVRVSNWTNGNVIIRIGADPELTPTGNGTFVTYKNIVGGTYFYVGGSSLTASVEFVSCKQITPEDWTLGDGWNLEAVDGQLTGKMACDGSQATAYTDITENVTQLMPSTTYRVLVRVSERTAGTWYISLGAGVQTAGQTSVGDFEFTLTTPAVPLLKVRGNIDFIGKVDWVIVLPATLPWWQGNIISNPNFTEWDDVNNPTDWTVNNPDANNYIEQNVNGARIVADNTVALHLLQVPSYVWSVGDRIRITIKKSDHVTGEIRLTLAGAFTRLAENISGSDANGTYTVDVVADAASALTVRIYRDTTANTDYVINEVRVEQVYALDVGGNYNHAQILNGADIRNHGVLLNGTDQYVQSKEPVNPGTTDFTIAVDIKVTGSTNTHLINSGGISVAKGYNVQQNLTKGRFKIADGTNRTQVDTATDINDGKPHTLVGLFDRDGNLTVYLDGSIDGTPEDMSTLSLDIDVVQSLFVGYDGTSIYQAGNIANVKVFSRLLSADEIRNVSSLTGDLLDMPLNHRYQFNDISGNNNHGTPIGNPQIIGEAAYFDGVDDYLDAGDRPSLKITGDITFSAWIKTAKKNTIMFEKWSGTDRGPYLQIDASGFLFLSLSQNPTGGTETLTGSKDVTNDAYHFITSLGKLNVEAKHYIDAVQDTQGAMPIPSQNPSAEPLSIGSNGEGGFFYGGYLIDPRVYSKALTADEIRALYAQGPQSLDPEVVASWRRADWPLVTQDVSDELVTNGDFSQLDYGPELCINGDFRDPTGWNLVDGMTISNGQCHYDNPAQYYGATRSLVTEAGKTYTASIRITRYVSGSVRMRFQGTTPQDILNNMNAVGTYEWTFEAVGNPAIAILSNTGNEDLSFTDISVKEVTPTGWTLGAGWALDVVNGTLTGKMRHTPGNTAALTQNGILNIGIIATLSVTIADRTAGNLYPYFGTNQVGNLLTNQTHVISDEAAGNTNLLFSPTTTFDGTIDDVSIKQITTPDIVARNDGQVAGAVISDAGADFDGVDDYIKVPDAVEIQNIFDNGGSIEFIINPRSLGGGGFGRIVDKQSTVVYVSTPTKIHLIKHHTTTQGQWIWSNAFEMNKETHVVFTYDSSNVANNAVGYTNGVLNTQLAFDTPAGDVVSDVGNDLFIGGSEVVADRHFDGIIRALKFHNHILPPWEVMNRYLKSGV